MIRNAKYDPEMGSLTRWNSFYSEWKLDLMNHWKNREIRYMQILQHIPKSASKIIDIGCGLGTGFKILGHMGYTDLWGCDTSTVAIEVCGVRFPECTTALFRAQELEYLDQRWDLGLFLQTVEHLENPGETIESVLRCVDTLLVSVPNKTCEIAAINEHVWLFEPKDFLECGAVVQETCPIIVAKFQAGVKYEFKCLSP